MCGIAGQYSFGSRTPDRIALDKVCERQRIRGPDAGGVYRSGNVALGHRRLKIFDLSERAAQPMVDEELGLALTFNGAIYNFRELRAELEQKGYIFVSHSDTEVLLKGFHAWGKAIVPRLNGMFAFAIHDKHSGELVLARDRMGIKPLYYAMNADSFCFASTLPGLLQFGGVDTSIDPVGLHYYLMFHATPEPVTILAGVRKIAPASIVTLLPNGGFHEETYWRFAITPDAGRSEAQFIKDTRAALRQATARQLSADVPVGILLSGGLDSSLITALAVEARGSDIETFSIGFEGFESEEGDEFIYSDMIAQEFGTRHHRIFVPNERLDSELDACVRAMSEPMVSHDNIGFYLLSQEVARHVKVVLSGQGADEIFAGYRWFETFGTQQSTPAEFARRVMDEVADRSFEDYEKLVRPEMQSKNHAHDFVETLTRGHGPNSAVENLLVYESAFALPNGPLARVDNMTMSSSLEARVPLLDELVVDAANAMPIDMKLRDGGKYALKQVARQILPAAVIDRPKGYFPVPALKHLRGRTLDLMRDFLSPETLARRGLFEPAAVAPLLDRPSAHLTRSGASQLWQIGLLEYWLRAQGI